MNKKAIWLIIGLMSCAVVGVGALQFYWISGALKLKQEEFENSVLSALSKVIDKLDADEDQAHISDVLNLENSSVQPLNFREEARLQMLTEAAAGSGKIFSEADIYCRKDKDGNVKCDCPNCSQEELDELQWKIKVKYYGSSPMSQLINPRKLVDRIDLSKLDTYLEKEFEKRGIRHEFSYGVFSNTQESFVIADGHYLVEDEVGQNPAQWNQLQNSPYKAELYPDDLIPPGLLMIGFPGQRSLLFGQVFWPLFLSILFTIIIMGSFYYTIMTIFRQKKLGEMKTDFINNMTHEFKTPIATISLAADSISSPMISGSPDKVKRFANIIRQENKRMNSQVEKVLQMAVLDKREFQLNLTPVNLNEVVAQAVGHSSLQVEKKEGTVEAILKASIPTIEGDVTHISNIIHNLLDNANKYSPEKPEISVTTRNVPNGVEVIVKDNGLGMGKEARKHIFDKFYRVHTGDLHNIKGFGLGLSYVKALMTAHKGQIDVKSELGKGSSFILFFPFQVENR
ncbi:MAG: HAMP domain-containing histidine kinase [Saprospiraceae bacterium]|nr:HAMP domain-containing histidine kinase [Saprospiraceae bacterium]